MGKPVAKEAKEAETAAPAAPAAAAVDPAALLVQYLKERAKLAEKQVLATAADPATTNVKAQRKLAAAAAQVAALEEQLKALGVDVDAAVQEAALAEKAAQWRDNVKAEFNTAWQQRLAETGRAELAATFAEPADPVQHEKAKIAKRISQSPLEAAREKLDRLKLKLEREEFHVEWLAAREAELNAQLEALRQPAAPAAAEAPAAA